MLGSRIRKWAQPVWNPNVVSHPNRICETCRWLLTFCEMEESSELVERPGATQRWRNFHLSNITVPRGALETQCPCQICEAWKSQGVGEKGFNNKVKKKIQIVTEIIVVEEAAKEEVKSCTICFQERIGKGIPHLCTKANRKTNLAEIVKKK